MIASFCNKFLTWPHRNLENTFLNLELANADVMENEGFSHDNYADIMKAKVLVATIIVSIQISMNLGHQILNDSF